jgi:hypothetical protein
MGAFRRRLASGALALTVLQLAVLFAAPVSACCKPFRPSADAARMENADAPDCCPPGSHAPGQCPLHRSKPQPKSHCRMMCDAPHGPQFLLGSVGLVPAPGSTQINQTSNALYPEAPLTVPARSSLPDAPPPRLL